MHASDGSVQTASSAAPVQYAGDRAYHTVQKVALQLGAQCARRTGGEPRSRVPVPGRDIAAAWAWLEGNAVESACCRSRIRTKEAERRARRPARSFRVTAYSAWRNRQTNINSYAGPSAANVVTIRHGRARLSVEVGAGRRMQVCAGRHGYARALAEMRLLTASRYAEAVTPRARQIREGYGACEPW